MPDVDLCNTTFTVIFPQTYDIPCKYTFTTVKPLSQYNIVSVAAGKTHSAVVDCKLNLFSIFNTFIVFVLTWIEVGGLLKCLCEESRLCKCG